MKIKSLRCFVAALVLAGGLLLTSSARAQITVINTPITSYGSILFNDTTSYNSFYFPGSPVSTRTPARGAVAIPLAKTLG